MEILVTVIAFWLILVGCYGAYSLTQERNHERAPRVRTQQRPAKLASAPATGGASPFAPVSLPSETVPGFISRATGQLRVDPLPPARTTQSGREQEAPDRFRAERVIAERVAQRTQVRNEEPSYDEPRYHQPRHDIRNQDAEEVTMLRAQVEHLRSEIYALSAEQPFRGDRPQQRRYRTGNYTHLPRTLRRQVNEVRGFRRFFS